jgi:hypothetical protein
LSTRGLEAGARLHTKEVRIRFVITGSGRSGTQYISRVLTLMGARVGHETWFGPRPGILDHNWMKRSLAHEIKARLAVERNRRRARLDGDVSWLAVPRLHQFRGIVLLQTRDPIRVVSSLVSRREFSRAATMDNPYLRFIRYHFDVTGDDIRDSMRWYVLWNARAERRADMAYRLEDLDETLLVKIANRVGIPARPRHARSALAAVPTTQNQTEDNNYERVTVTWADLPVGPERAALVTAAERYGYAGP